MLRLRDDASAVVLRSTLDRFEVGNRLEHIRQFVWRGGELRFVAGVHDVCYVLTAHWPAPAFERARGLDNSTALVAMGGSILEGRWVRGASGYELRVGIDLAVPSAMYIRSGSFSSHVPINGRRDTDVEDSLQRELTIYVDHFLDTSRSVPDAAARDLARLERVGLA